MMSKYYDLGLVVVLVEPVAELVSVELEPELVGLWVEWVGLLGGLVVLQVLWLLYPFVWYVLGLC
jgi:hypothetical protein